MQNIGINELKKTICNTDKVYLYGASVTGKGILRLLHGAHIEIEAFIDKDESKYGNLLCGKNVIPAKDVPKDAYIIITASGKYYESISKMFEEEYGILNVYVLLKENRIAKTPLFAKGYDKQLISDYERDFDQIKNEYEKIEMYFIWADRIGELIYRFVTMSYELSNVYDKVYRIIMPYTVDGSTVANGRLLNMMKRKIDVAYGDNIGFWNYLIEEHQSEIIDWKKCWRYDEYYKELHPDWRRACLYNTGDSPIVTFSDKEIEEAEIKADKIGINKKFVCVFARDAKYLGSRVKDGYKGYSYHNYRDFNVASYKLLADYLKDKDMQVVRVGNVQEGRLQGSNVVDITGENYDELLDLYINSKCEYWVGCNSGAIHIPGFFKRKIIRVNLSSLVDSYWSALFCIDNGAYIPKLLYYVKENRYLSIKEMCKLNISGVEPYLYNESLGVRFIENVSEDILELYKECDLKACGKWEYTKEERNLQKRYNNVLDEFCNENRKWLDDYGYNIRDCIVPLSIGSSFLKKYEEFLLP